MYRHCTFCANDLGTNEVLEDFPVGRRLAYDGQRGRLWVVCPVCERWNLTPLEERWEAIEQSERLFRQTPLRASSNEIGLARHREGLELVRIGRPLRPEFAAWRYGDQFGRRRRRFIRHGVIGAGLVGGLALGSVATVGGLVGLQLGTHAINLAQLLRHSLTPTLRLHRGDGDVLTLRPRDLNRIKLRPGGAGGGADVESGSEKTGDSNPWHLRVERGPGRETEILTGHEAVRALRAILPRINSTGGSKSTVSAAVRELEDAGGPDAYFAHAEPRARRSGHGYMNLPGLPPEIRLALEMAAHEDAERVALEGELAWLETAWREAEEIAAIADDLGIPERVRIRLAELKMGWGREG